MQIITKIQKKYQMFKTTESDRFPTKINQLIKSTAFKNCIKKNTIQSMILSLKLFVQFQIFFESIQLSLKNTDFHLFTPA